MTTWIRCAIGLVAVLLFSRAVARGVPQDRITILQSEVRQRIDGFGLNFTGGWFDDDQKQMFQTFIDDLGVTKFRVVPYIVASDWEQVNDNDDPDVMNWEYYNKIYSGPRFESSWRAIRYLNSRGIRPTIALMGPVPKWMLADKISPPQHKVCQPAIQMAPLSPAMYPEFAETVVSMLKYARDHEHLEFDTFSPFNETDCYPPEGPRIDPDQAPAVLLAVAHRLQREGMGDVKLSVAEQAVITTDYTTPILENAELMKSVGVFAYHTYEENSVGPQVQRVLSSPYANLPVWLTEYGDLSDQDQSAANDWKSFSLAGNRRALTALNQGANAIFYFDAFDDYEECAARNTYYGLYRSAEHRYTPRKRYYATRQLYHFVRPGSHRVELAGEIKGLTVSAFLSPSSDSVTIVGVKEGGPNRIKIEFPKDAPTPKTLDLYITTPSIDSAKQGSVPVQNGVAVVDLPDETIFTLVGATREH
jgi:O-glycosyl hydrolase